MTTFKSKMDSWILIVLLISVAISVLAAVSLLLQGTRFVNVAVAVFLLAVGAFLPLWLLATTRYVVHGHQLEVQCGPMKWTINIADISSITETNNILSSPALSLDRLLIRYKNKEIMISPADKAGFLKALEQRGLQVGK